jgi:hypothetical protein
LASDSTVTRQWKKMARANKAPSRPLPTSVALSAETKAAIIKAARVDERSQSSLLQKIINDWLRAHGFLKRINVD